MSYNNNYTTWYIKFWGDNMRNMIVDDWINYLESIKENSSNTIRSYENDVISFLQFIKYKFALVDCSISEISEIEIRDIKETTIAEIGIRDLIAYISYTDKHLNNSPSTRSRKLSSLRNFFDYLYKIIGVITSNPMSLIDGPKIPKRIPNYLELEEVKRLLTAVLENEDEFYRLRDYAIIMLFLNTGLRLSELVNMELDHLDKNETVRIIGKGNKERIIYFNSSVSDSLKQYLEIRPDGDAKNVFTNKSGNQFLGNRGIQYMLNKYLKKCGLGGKYSPHSLRHTAATLLYQYGNVDIRTLQVILGHESVSTTQIYTHVNSSQIKEAVNLNPIKDLELKK